MSQIAIAMVAAKGIKNPAPDGLHMIAGAVQGLHRGKCVVRVGEGMPARWKVA